MVLSKQRARAHLKSSFKLWTLLLMCERIWESTSPKIFQVCCEFALEYLTDIL